MKVHKINNGFINNSLLCSWDDMLFIRCYHQQKELCGIRICSTASLGNGSKISCQQKIKRHRRRFESTTFTVQMKDPPRDPPAIVRF